MGGGNAVSERGSIGAVVAEATSPTGDLNASRGYLPVQPDDGDRIRRAGGIDVAGFTHAVDASAGRHILNRHGPGGTADRTVTPDQFDKLHEIVGRPDDVEVRPPSKATRGLATIIYRKRDGGNWLVVEEVRTRRKRLALVSMYKEKATAP